MKNILNHQTTDRGIARYHFHRAGIGPLNHRKLANVLDLGHNERQGRLELSGLGRNGEQCLDGFHIRGHQASGLMGGAGDDNRRGIQTGHPMQGVRLDCRP